MKDDFEYHITFPQVDTSYEFVKEPVIVLFGWAGCADRHLAKYSKVYEKQGFTTIRFVTSPSIMSPTFSNQMKLHSVAEKVVSLLIDMSFNEHPIFFHMFSNGGCYVYRHVSEILQKDHKEEFQIKGCIFDSSPAKVNMLGLIRSAVALTQGSIMWKYCVAIYVLMQSIFLHIFQSFFNLFTNQLTRTRMWNNLLDESNICPQLFLFSTADNICDWKSIHEFAEKRKGKGVQVDSVMWDDSAHVQHMVSHEEAYCSAICTFATSQLRDHMGEVSP